MMGLVANVSLSLTDPFVYMGIDLLAQTGSNSSTTGQCIRCDNIDDVDCQTVWIGDEMKYLYNLIIVFAIGSSCKTTNKETKVIFDLSPLSLFSTQVETISKVMTLPSDSLVVYCK